MDKHRRSILFLIFLFLWSGAVSAEEPGGLDAYFFLENRAEPIGNTEVFVQGQDSGLTNENGAVRFRLPPGTYALILTAPDGKEVAVQDLEVLSGEVTEAIVTLRQDAPPLVDREVAAHALETDADAGPAEIGPRYPLSGHVKNIEDAKPIENARVFVKGRPEEARTDAGGVFELELPRGLHALSIVHPDFSTQTVDEVPVGPDAPHEIEIELTPASLELADYTVSAPQIEGGIASLNEERKATSAVSDIIGAEQMSKSGDSTAASALRRVTGLTLVGGKYVYVRGMGERYSSTVMNGSTLPSPEPERRVVPLDMFPVGIIQSVLIQKTYAPDLPGEFGGGAIQIRSRGRPEDFYLNASISLGFSTDTTFRKGLTYKGGKADFLGIDDGTRALPSSVRRASSNQALLESDRFSDSGYSPEELERFGESMPNIWNPYKMIAPPDLGLSVTVGDSYEIAEQPIGFLFSVLYDSGWEIDKSKKTYFNIGGDGELERQHQYRFESMTRNVSLGTMLDVSTELFRHHELKSTTILIRTTDDEARVYEGFNRDVATDIKVTRLRWVERMLLFQQVSGSHLFKKAQNLSLDWRYTFSMAMRDEPDRREYRYDFEPGTARWRLSDRPEGNQRLFSELVDNNHDLGFDFSIPYPVWLGLEAKAKAGFNFVHRKRIVDTRRFKFNSKGPLSTDNDIIAEDPESIFVPANIGSDGFQFEEITRQTDNYDAGQLVLAGYLMTDLPILEQLRLSFGARVEHGRQSVRTYELFNPDSKPIEAKLENTDILPAGTLTWEFYRNFQARAGYGMTISRPDFRELSPATFNDVTGGRQIFGNPDLKRAVLQNVDARVEWYPSARESISVGFFFKHFKDPIETVVVPSAQQSITYANAKSAKNLGAEFEMRKNFDFIHKAVRDLYLAGNVAYIWSRIELDGESGIQTSDKRPLQGQSPYVANVQLGYDNPDWGTSLAAIYNVFGKRIVEVGAQGAPDVLERPVHQLDFVASQALGMGFKLSFKAKNLIDPVVRLTQGKETVENSRKGRSFSLGLSWTY